MKKLKRKKTNQQSQPDVPGSFVSANFSSRSRPGLVKKIVVAVIIGLFLAAGAGGYFMNRGELVVKQPLPADINTDYETTPRDSLLTLLEYDYNLSEQALDHGNLTELLKDFEMTENVALSLYRLDKPARSLEAYVIADSQAPESVGYGFYKTACRLAYKQQNSQFGERMCAKAKEKIQASSLSDQEKITEAYFVDRIKDLVKEDTQ